VTSFNDKNGFTSSLSLMDNVCNKVTVYTNLHVPGYSTAMREWSLVVVGWDINY
jgi:hypothetical protein